MRTDFDKKLGPAIEVYRPKEKVYNIDVNLLPNHKTNTYTVEKLVDGGVVLNKVDERPATGYYSYTYQLKQIPVVDSTGGRHGTTTSRYINTQRMDGPFKVWYMVYFPGFTGYNEAGEEKTLGSCVSETIEVKGVHTDDWWTHPYDPEDE